MLVPFVADSPACQMSRWPTSSAFAPTAPGCTETKRGEPFLPRDDFRREFAARKQSGESVVLGSAARACVDTSIRATCANREWQLLALNVRTNHVHLVVSATVAPERVMDALKAWATRRLRAAGLAAADARIWSRHGSTERIWLQRELDAACEYVTNGQDEKLA